MEENKKIETLEAIDTIVQQEEESSFDIRTIFTLLVLNWQWFALSMLIFVFGALIYLRYAEPMYQMSVKMLIKEETNNRRGGNQMLANMQDLGFMTNSTGIDNEVEILKSRILALEAIKDLKLYTEYRTQGRVKKMLIYKTQPVTVDLDPAHLEELNKKLISIDLKITKEDGKYHVSSIGKDVSFEGKFANLPAMMKTDLGVFTFTKNLESKSELEEGQVLYATIFPPNFVASGYARSLSVEPTSKMTSIAQLTLNDRNANRAFDYLKQLALCYNRQANADKNEIAYKTEEFINSRLEKINSELGATETELESYKRRNNLIQLRLDATQTLTQSSQYTAQLAQANTQMQLLDYLR